LTIMLVWKNAKSTTVPIAAVSSKPVRLIPNLPSLMISETHQYH
jgi:hypothetical protein